MLTPEERATINQANAQNSTGPRTEEGKARSSLNARRHGLTGQTLVMSDLESEAYFDFTRPLLESFAPVGPRETQYAQLIVQDHWRLNRIAAIEQTMLKYGSSRPQTCIDDTGHPATDDAFTEAEVFRLDGKQMALLTLYESRINRNIRNNTKHLEELRTIRKAAEAEALEEAELLAELAAHEGWTFDPQEHGFDFSREQFETNQRKKTLLAKARNYRYSKPKRFPRTA